MRRVADINVRIAEHESEITGLKAEKDRIELELLRGRLWSIAQTRGLAIIDIDRKFSYKIWNSAWDDSSKFEVVRTKFPVEYYLSSYEVFRDFKNIRWEFKQKTPDEVQKEFVKWDTDGLAENCHVEIRDGVSNLTLKHFHISPDEIHTDRDYDDPCGITTNYDMNVLIIKPR